MLFVFDLTKWSNGHWSEGGGAKLTDVKMNVIKGCKYNKPMSKMDNIVRRFKLYSDSAMQSPQPSLALFFQISLSCYI